MCHHEAVGEVALVSAEADNRADDGKCRAYNTSRKALGRGNTKCTRDAGPSGFCGSHEGSHQFILKKKLPGQTGAMYKRLGQAQKISPLNALLSMIYEAAGNVAYLREKVTECEKLVIAGKKEREEIAKIVVLYGEERDRLQKYVTDALRIGIEVKQVRLYQMQAEALVAMARSMVEKLGLVGEQKKEAFRIAADELRAYTAAQAKPWQGPYQEAVQA